MFGGLFRCSLVLQAAAEIFHFIAEFGACNMVCKIKLKIKVKYKIPCALYPYLNTTCAVCVRLISIIRFLGDSRKYNSVSGTRGSFSKFSSICIAVRTEDVPHQAKAGQKAEAEQTDPSVVQDADGQHNPLQRQEAPLEEDQAQAVSFYTDWRSCVQWMSRK